MLFVTDCSVLEMVGTLLVNEKDPGVECFDITRYLLRLKQLKYLYHHPYSPPLTSGELILVSSCVFFMKSLLNMDET